MRRFACVLVGMSCWMMTASAVADSHVPPPKSPPPRQRPRLMPPPLPAPQVVIARLVDGERPIIACGVIAYIGVYVYEIERVESGTPLSGRITVDVLCPDFHRDKVKFKIGERHRLELGRARRTYAGATPRPSPLPAAPRFEGKKVTPAPAPP